MAAHVHAELMKQYAEDAMETDRPWERWEYMDPTWQTWQRLSRNPMWYATNKYRRKPRTIRIGEYNVPEPVRDVEYGTKVWVVCPSGPNLDVANKLRVWFASALEAGLVHLDRESAELHYKAITSFTRVDGPSV